MLDAVYLDFTPCLNKAFSHTYINEFNAFNVVRFDAGSTQAIIDNKSNQITPKD
ncbi:hypothetical protein HUE58_05490 [Candidatus Ruthia endofausta]|uniref:Uncharacterized protein n=1 Tax=Candidatus Ruthia endofausta TaxID=2738852 RepID=A0A6N0HQM6_9GAMM|nr:hypothetical protein [Candidatus Ruthia endofausta]QKQ24558.1 hypothetical protein HUE58_05490 [Candidatus Ruthia endofausta]